MAEQLTMEFNDPFKGSNVNIKTTKNVNNKFTNIGKY